MFGGWLLMHLHKYQTIDYPDRIVCYCNICGWEKVLDIPANIGYTGHVQLTES